MWERTIDWFAGLREDAEEWTTGRSAPWRLPLLAYLIYAGVRHLADPLYRSWFAGITLIFHEMGHMLFSMMGHTLLFLGGTILQIVVPLAAGAQLLFRQRDYYGVAVCGGWLSFSLWDIATYVSDANKENLPLVAMGDNCKHDWATLLTEWRVLNYCDTFASVIRVLAFVAWAGSMAAALWLCFLMWKSRDSSRGFDS